MTLNNTRLFVFRVFQEHTDIALAVSDSIAIGNNKNASVQKNAYAVMMSPSNKPVASKKGRKKDQ